MKMAPDDLILIKQEAEKEIYLDAFRAAVAAEKVRLQTKKTFWERVFPFKITITRR